MLTQGLSRTTASAITGTMAGLLITGVLAAVVTALARFTPAQGSEEVLAIGQLAGNTIDLSGLLLAGVVFGGLGVLNDVAISQAATVEELRAVDPTIGRRALFGRTMNVGIAHLGATVNTLVFAYLGSALPLLVLFSIQVRGLGFPLNEEIIAVEVVRTLVGSIGIVLTVPITTAIAVRFVGSDAAGARLQRARSTGDRIAGRATRTMRRVSDTRGAPSDVAADDVTGPPHGGSIEPRSAASGDGDPGSTTLGL